MYVCVCNALNEDQFRTVAIQHPDASVERAFKILKRPPDCGSCLDFAERVMKEARDNPPVEPDRFIP